MRTAIAVNRVPKWLVPICNYIYPVISAAYHPVISLCLDVVPGKSLKGPGASTSFKSPPTAAAVIFTSRPPPQSPRRCMPTSSYVQEMTKFPRLESCQLLVSFMHPFCSATWWCSKSYWIIEINKFSRFAFNWHADNVRTFFSIPAAEAACDSEPGPGGRVSLACCVDAVQCHRLPPPPPLRTVRSPINHAMAVIAS